VIELASTIGASPSDQGPRGVYASRRKMAVYMANGARLGWLLFPEQRAVEICPSDGGVMEPGEPLRNEPALTLEGGELLPGLRLELAEMWSNLRVGLGLLTASNTVQPGLAGFKAAP
jgi:Uma2 family endonuclease